MSILLLNACVIPSSRGLPGPSPAESVLASAALDDIVRNYVAHEQSSRFELRTRLGVLPESLPALSGRAVREEARFARAAIRRIDGVGVEALSESNYITLLSLRYALDGVSEHAIYHTNDLTDFSPGGPLRDAARLMAEHQFTSETDGQRYLTLLTDLAGYADTLRSELMTRATLGFVLSRPAIARAVGFFATFAEVPEKNPLRVDHSRLTLLDTAVSITFRQATDSVLIHRVAPAFARLTTFLSGSYGANAPGTVGLWQYPGGRAYYGTLVRRWTTLDITPEQAHEGALREVARIDTVLKSLRQRLGGPVDAVVFHEKLRRNPALAASDASQIVDRLFLAQGSVPTDADTTHEPVRVWPVVIPPAAASSPNDRVAGRYQPPSGADSVGRYAFGPAMLSPGMLTLVDALSFYALLPGWHELLGRRLQSTLDIARYYPSVPAFADGWALTAVEIAQQRGSLSDPLSQYGAGMLEMIACVRALVDSGIHYFGWNDAQARALFGQYTLLNEADIAEEVAHIAFDAPGRGLAACIGRRELAGIRHWMQRELKSDFDERRFYDEVGSLGPIPLQAVGRHFEWWLYQERTRARAKAQPVKPAPRSSPSRVDSAGSAHGVHGGIEVFMHADNDQVIR